MLTPTAIPHTKLIPTNSIPNPTKYVELLQKEFSNWAYDQEIAHHVKGHWRANIFNVANECPMDLEIGTGNGYFFAHQSKHNPDRCLVGLEITYKTLIQTIRRAVATGATNMRMVRFHASNLSSLFQTGELNNIFIYFPDPWPKKKHEKNRLFHLDFLLDTYDLQRPHSFLDFKTDSLDYFNWSIERIKKSPYKMTRLTHDLHNSDWASENFVTHFEKLWTCKGIKTNYLRLEKV